MRPMFRSRLLQQPRYSGTSFRHWPSQFSRSPGTLKSLYFFEPLVILDGQLYEAYLNLKNELNVKKITHIPICFGYVSVAYRHADEFSNYYVELVTLDYLANLIHNKDIWLDGIASTISHNIQNLSKHK